MAISDGSADEDESKESTYINTMITDDNNFDNNYDDEK